MIFFFAELQKKIVRKIILFFFLDNVALRVIATKDVGYMRKWERMCWLVGDFDMDIIDKTTRDI